MALISINLAVLNALPLPLLDGGQMALLLIEGVRGKPVPERFQLAVRPIRISSSRGINSGPGHSRHQPVDLRSAVAWALMV